jgi:hypothetical protein
MKKNVFSTGILAIMLVFGLILVSCETDTPDSTRTHKFEYEVTDGTLTITGEGESSTPKTGDSFTLEMDDGKKATGTIEVAEDGTITFKKGDTEVFPEAKIEGDGLKIEEEGEIILDGNGGTKTQPAGTLKPPLYTVSWGYMGGVTYSQAASNAAGYGVTFKSAGSNAGYLTGNDATGAYSIMMMQFSSYFNGGGSVPDSPFEELLNFQENGIGLPSALKSAMGREKANVPIAAVFQVNQGGGSGIVVFYVEEAED